VGIVVLSTPGGTADPARGIACQARVVEGLRITHDVEVAGWGGRWRWPRAHLLGSSGTQYSYGNLRSAASGAVDGGGCAAVLAIVVPLTVVMPTRRLLGVSPTVALRVE
jgi:hypothetical protein